VQGALAGVPGVSDAKVRFDAKEADVTFDPAKTDTAKLVAAVSAANEQYKAVVKK
jgi:copper chaperone CopZ